MTSRFYFNFALPRHSTTITTTTVSSTTPPSLHCLDNAYPDDVSYPLE
jgi:hypothetical protein